MRIPNLMPANAEEDLEIIFDDIFEEQNNHYVERSTKTIIKT